LARRGDFDLSVWTLTVSVPTSNASREIEEENPMIWRRLFQWDAVRARSARPPHAARGRELNSTRRRQRPGVEALEGRQLLAALSEFPLSSNQSAGAALTAGPDGNLWFPVQEGAGPGQIARITPAGVLTDFALPTSYSSPSALIVGPDGNLWFTDIKNSGGTRPAVAQITPAGVITEFATTSGYSSASGLTLGPDGNLWFTESSPTSSGIPTASVGRITTAGVISEFPLNSTDNVVSTLTVGPDQNLWFSTAASTNFSTSAATIGRITPSGTVSEFALPSNYYNASALTTGPDGNLWFSIGSFAIGRITPTGTISEYPIAATGGGTSTLTVGPDGNLWFSEEMRPGFITHNGSSFPGNPAEIGRITPAGSITEFPLAPDLSPYSLSGLTVGPDKNLYFTFSGFGSAELAGSGLIGAFDIGRITTSGTVVEFTGTVPSSSSGNLTNTYAPTAGSDGNLWFPDGPNIGRLEPALATPGQAIPPTIMVYASLNRSKEAITSVVLTFDEAMNSASAGTRSFYSVAAGVKKHHMMVLKIRSVTYDPTAETATLKLASPFKAKQLQVTVHGGIMAANGTSTEGDATAIAY
jgi:virginiamycin B lyase